MSTQRQRVLPKGLLRDGGLAAAGALLLSLPVLGPVAGSLNSSWGPGDMLSTYNNVAQWAGFGYRVSDHNGFPADMNLNLFPGTDITQNSFAAAISALTGSPFTGLNALIWLSFPIVAFLAVVAMRLVGLRGAWAIGLALAFDFIPYHWGRALGHTYLSTMYAAVTAVILALLIARGDLDHRREHHRFWWWAAVALLLAVTAWSGVYYAAFGALLIASALVWRWVTGAPWPVIGRNSLLLLFLGVLWAIALLPAALARMSESVSELGNRPAYESVELAGSLAMILLPAPVSVLPYGGYYNEAIEAFISDAPFNEAMAVTNFGTWTSMLSLLLSVVLIAIRLRRGLAIPTQTKFVGFSMAIVILFFIPWGLNSLFAGFVTAQIRAWNRLTPVLLLLVFLLLASLLTHSRTLHRPRVAGVALVGIVGMVLLDQVLPYRSMYASTVSRFAEETEWARSYAQEAQAQLEKDCGVLQLPHMVYPENGQVEPSLNDYEHLWQSITAPNLKWSYGAVRGTEGANRVAEIAEAALTGDLQTPREAGFCAIHVDLRGFEKAEGLGLVEALGTQLGEPLVTGHEGDWLLFTLR